MSETLEFQLNDKTVQVKAGMTVMEAAKQEGVMIPHFCWHPALSIAGVCRFCMVKVEGMNKLEIACNLPVRAGMVVRTDIAEVKDAHKWALEYHLINHPLDCPICDQAGECDLQNYYMDVGLYESQLRGPKVLKPKALDAGSELVLDTERCILCSRCVRFEEEVTKTGALGIFDRGDRAIIGTYEGEKITHKYQENLVDICPVGAFTSKKFRFKQRVWFLESRESVCPGCSTGCHVYLHGKEQTGEYFRVKPRYSAEKNGHWICDEGRRVLDHLGPGQRVYEPLVAAEDAWVEQTWSESWARFAEVLQNAKEKVLLIAPDYTVEEYEAIFRFFVEKHGFKALQWRSADEDIDAFDGFLLRGDRHPNTRGLAQVLEKHGFSAKIEDEFQRCLDLAPDLVVAFAPEINTQNLKTQLESLGKLSFVALGTVFYPWQTNKPDLIWPLKSFVEKRGTFLNYQGVEGVLDDPFGVMAKVYDLGELVAEFSEIMGGE